MDIENIHPINTGVGVEAKESTKGFETLLQEVRTLQQPLLLHHSNQWHCHRESTGELSLYVIPRK